MNICFISAILAILVISYIVIWSTRISFIVSASNDMASNSVELTNSGSTNLMVKDKVFDLSFSYLVCTRLGALSENVVTFILQLI